MSTPENTSKNRSLFDGVQDVAAADGNEYPNIEGGLFTWLWASFVSPYRPVVAIRVYLEFYRHRATPV